MLDSRQMPKATTHTQQNPSHGKTMSTPALDRATHRRKRLERSNDPPAFQLTQRDTQLIDWIYQLRAATTDQLQRLLFPADGYSPKGRLTHCQYRLKLLYHHGYVTRDERPTRLSDGRQPLVYFLDTRGAELLAAQAGVEVGRLDWRARDNAAKAGHFFLEHLLATNEVRINLTVAAHRAGVEVVRWLDDRTLRRTEMKEYVHIPGEGKVAIVPDGFFELSSGTPTPWAHFLEADRRTVVGVSSKAGRRDWVRKVRAYTAFAESGQYAARYKAKDFRVLIVTTGETRLANLKAITQDAGGQRRFWFTTYEQITNESALYGEIWAIAGTEGHYRLLRKS